MVGHAALAIPDAGRTAILNGFGRSLGDGIIGMQALAVARARGAVAAPVLFRLPGLPAIVRDVYAAGADLADVRDLPWTDETPARPFAGAAGFGAVIDLRDFAFDPGFRGVAMIDFFLGRLGVDAAAVAPSDRHNAWLAPRLFPAGPPARGDGPVLVCPRASMPMRDMPDAVHARILRRLADAGVAFATQADLPPAPGLAALCAQVAAAPLVISTDTAMVHLADAFDVPCLAFFTTHDPAWRVRDYPRCRAIHLPAGLPPALEFARSDNDVRAAHAAWLAPGADLRWLDEAVDAALRDAGSGGARNATGS